MIKDEILSKTTWNDYQIGTCSIYVPLFKREILFKFFQDHDPEPDITDKMLECIHDVLALKRSELETLKEMLWEECTFSFTVADYGFIPENGETHLQAHLKGFDISNKEDAYSKSNVQEIQVSQENDTYIGRYSQIIIDSASDNLINIIVKNGKLIDWADNGAYIGWFEKDEQYSKNRRKNALSID